MLQSWRWLTFLHWLYEPEVIRRLLPKQLTLDTYEKAAWVGLTPFLLRNLRPPGLPRLPWISRFPETNVRTYVRGPGGERGVWFFTLEADRLAAVVGARSLYHLPYRWAKMRVWRNSEVVEYESERKWPLRTAHTRIAIQVGGRKAAGNFDNFLTARYRLYTLVLRRLAFAQIEHAPWRLQEGRVLRLEQNLVEKSGVPRPGGEPTVHFSEDIDVRIGRLRWA